MTERKRSQSRAARFYVRRSTEDIKIQQWNNVRGRQRAKIISDGQVLKDKDTCKRVTPRWLKKRKKKARKMNSVTAVMLHSKPSRLSPTTPINFSISVLIWDIRHGKTHRSQWAACPGGSEVAGWEYLKEPAGTCQMVRLVLVSSTAGKRIWYKHSPAWELLSALKVQCLQVRNDQEKETVFIKNKQIK